jgi:hypothetical protein
VTIIFSKLRARLEAMKALPSLSLSSVSMPARFHSLRMAATTSEKAVPQVPVDSTGNLSPLWPAWASRSLAPAGSAS